MKTLTVGEVIEKLKKMPKSANVFMLTDRTIQIGMKRMLNLYVFTGLNMSRKK